MRRNVDNLKLLWNIHTYIHTHTYEREQAPQSTLVTTFYFQGYPCIKKGEKLSDLFLMVLSFKNQEVENNHKQVLCTILVGAARLTSPFPLRMHFQ